MLPNVASPIKLWYSTTSLFRRNGNSRQAVIAKIASCFPWVALLPVLSLCTASEFAIISSRHAYLVNEDDTISEKLHHFDTVDILEENDTWLKVRTESSEGWLRRDFVHLSQWIPEIDQQSAPKIRMALASAAKSARLSAKGEQAAALEAIAQGLKQVENAAGDSCSLYAWLLTFQATEQLNNDDVAGAKRTLKRAESILKEMNGLKALYAPDLYNVKGILAQFEEDFDQALADYQQALLICSSQLGVQHADCRVIHANMASCYHDRGDKQLAIQTQSRLLEISEAIMPPLAEELAQDHHTLGLYYRFDGQLDMARLNQLEGLLVYLEFDPEEEESLVTLYDTRKEISQAISLLELTTLFAKDLPAHLKPNYGSGLNLLGLIEDAAGRDEVALEQYQKALKQFAGNESSVDAVVILENLALLQMELEYFEQSKLNFEKALELRLDIDGAESKTVQTVRDRLAELEKSLAENAVRSPKSSAQSNEQQDASPNISHLMVTSARGYLLDDQLEVVSTVPRASLLEVIQPEGNYFVVQHDQQKLRIHKAAVRFGNMLPSQGVMSIEQAKPIYQLLAQSRQMSSEGRYTESVELAIQAGTQISKKVGNDNGFYIFACSNIIVAALEAGRVELSNIIELQQLALLEDLKSRPNPCEFDLQASRLFKANFFEWTDTQVSALAELNRLIAAPEFTGSVDTIHVNTSNVLNMLGQGKFEQASKLQDRVFHESQKVYPKTSIELAQAASLIALLTALQGGMDEAMQLSEKAVATAEQVKGNPSKVDDIRRLHALILKHHGQHDESFRILSSIDEKSRDAKSPMELNQSIRTLLEMTDIAAATNQPDVVVDLANAGLLRVQSLRGISGIPERLMQKEELTLRNLLISALKAKGNSTEAAKQQEIFNKILESASQDAQATPPEDNSQPSTQETQKSPQK